MEQEHITRESDWREFLLRQCARTPIEGTVTAVMPFGAFVRVHDGVDGLLHASEWGQQPQVGATVPVRILDLDLTRRRVSLAPA
jgi:small subunit ribosomal protein S1